MARASTIGVVVPNFNGVRFLRQALDSLLGQTRPPDEVLVMDGGSSDGSQALLQEYRPRIKYVSQRDGGQADAIARGFRALESELVGWLNSDDRLMPDALERIEAAAAGHPGAVLYFGDAEQVDEWGRLVGHIRAVDVDYDRMRRQGGLVVQPGSFYRATAVARAGGVGMDYHLLMDLDLWIRLLRQGPAVRLAGPLAQFRLHAAAKSSQAPWRYYAESLRIGARHERDRLVRATTRRLAGAARHLIAFHARASGSQARRVPPPASPPSVSSSGPMPGMLATLVERGLVAPGGPRPQVEVIGARALARRPARRAWGRAVIMAEEDRIDLGGMGLRLHPVSFALVPDASRAEIVSAGIPACRVGDVRSEDDWVRALALACGSWPGIGRG